MLDVAPIVVRNTLQQYAVLGQRFPRQDMGDRQRVDHLEDHLELDRGQGQSIVQPMQ